MSEDVVLLHGFGGTRRAWDGVLARLDPERYRPLALDLPGHGAQAGVRPLTFDACVAHVLDAAPARFALCGYSLGGRVALHVALAAPARVTRLVLVSASPGIEDADARARRREADEAWAAELERGPFDSFVERWRAQPVFAGEAPAVAALARADQLRNRPDALATAMRALGAGAMAPLWDRLAELRMPVTVLAGERDAKYVSIARRIVGMVGGPARLVLMPGAGHGLVLEAPGAVAEAIAR